MQFLLGSHTPMDQLQGEDSVEVTGGSNAMRDLQNYVAKVTLRAYRYQAPRKFT
jgi:hypothetical protein